MKTLLVVNGQRGKHPLSDRLLGELRAAVERTGPGSRLAVSRSIEEARELVDQACREGFEALWMGGGDGTINVLLNHAFGRGLVLGVVPMGTVNALARSLGIPLDPATAAWRLLSATPRPFDAAQVAGRRFLCFASVGFDAAVVHEVQGEVKRHWGRVAFLAAGLRALVTSGRLARFAVEFEPGTVSRPGAGAPPVEPCPASASRPSPKPDSQKATGITGATPVPRLKGVTSETPNAEAVSSAGTDPACVLYDLEREGQEVPFSQEGYSLVVSKIYNYAGLPLFRHVEPCSGAMETWLFRNDRPDELLAWIAGATAGELGTPVRHYLSDAVGHYMATRFTVRSDEPLYLQIDGEPIEPENPRELHFECLAGAVHLLVPRFRGVWDR